MIIAHVMHRTFWVKVGNSDRTAFTIDVDGRQYLCTAKHDPPNEGWENLQQLDRYQDDGWNPLGVEFVGLGSEDTDICVFAPKQMLSPPSPPLHPTSNGLIYGQEVYFLGFPSVLPFGKVKPLNMKVEEANSQKLPFPCIKRAILSWPAVSYESQGILYLDGHNTRGFSGGPVVFRNIENTNNEFHVAAVIKGYRAEDEPVVAGPNNGVMSVKVGSGMPEPMVVPQNSGLVISHDISHAIDAINSNPIGFELPLQGRGC